MVTLACWLLAALLAGPAAPDTDDPCPAAGAPSCAVSTGAHPRVLAVAGVRTISTVSAANVSRVCINGTPPQAFEAPPNDDKLSSVSYPAPPDVLLLAMLPSGPAATDTLPCTLQLNAAMGAAEEVDALLPAACKGSARISLHELCCRAALASCGVIVATAAPKGVLTVTCRAGPQQGQEHTGTSQ